MILITIFRWGYKPTNITGGPILYGLAMFGPCGATGTSDATGMFRAAPPAACLCCERLSSQYSGVQLELFFWVFETVLIVIQWDIIVIQWDINGTYPLVICYIAIENGPVEIVSFPMNSMVDLSIVMLNYRRVGILGQNRLFFKSFQVWEIIGIAYSYNHGDFTLS